MPVTQNSWVPDTAPPCPSQASSLYSTGANVLTQNSCWGQTHGHLKCTPWCHTARHAPPWMCLWGSTQPRLDTPLQRDLLPYLSQDARTNKGYKAPGAGVNALFLNNSPFWWMAPGHNNASLCNGNKHPKTSSDAVFSLLKHPPRIYTSHALLFPCTWNDNMEMRTSVYKTKQI